VTAASGSGDSAGVARSAARPPELPGPAATDTTGPPPFDSWALWGPAIGLFALLGLTTVLGTVGVVQLVRVVAAIDSDRSPGAVQDARDSASVAVAFLGLIAFGVLGFWVTWQFRHARHARLLGQRGGLAPGWAIAAWFVPVAGLVLVPLQLLQSGAAGRRGGERATGSVVAVLVWWLSFTVSVTLLLVVAPSLGEPDELGRADTAVELRSSRMALAGMVAGVAASVAAIVVVSVFSARQSAALRRREAAAGGSRSP
jgi:hypothetical protein